MNSGHKKKKTSFFMVELGHKEGEEEHLKRKEASLSKPNWVVNCILSLQKKENANK